MKTSILYRTVIVSVILLSRWFPSDSILADSCPTPSFAAARTFAVGVKPYFVVVGDFNADGKPDLAVATDNGISLLVGNGDGTFQAAVNLRSGSTYMVVGDFNGDGKPDLALTGGPFVAVLFGKGDGTFETAMVYD